MTTTDEAAPGHDDAWQGVDEGWGRAAVDFATLSEPANCREYVALHHRLRLRAPDRVLDVACGAGLALELAALRGATCSGIDASPRLIGVARDRLPDADLRVGDMHQMPWADASFDVVTSFRGIWGTTPDAVTEARRVLAPGGRLGLTVWGHIKQSSGAWALSPFRLASETKVANQAAMVALGRPGAGEELLARCGLTDIERHDIPFVWEFADPETYARALASTGPAYEAIQAVGEPEFLRRATEVAQERVRAGLPLRASIAVVGFTARNRAPRRSLAAASSDGGQSPESSFLPALELTPDVEAFYAEDVADWGFVMNVSRMWAHQQAPQRALFDLLGTVATAASITKRDKTILISAAASTLGDAYCAMAWGHHLASEVGGDGAAAVLSGDDSPLTEREGALARWARSVARDPNATTAAEVDELRGVGYDDAQILALTLFIALRLAFSSVNDALGARPDRALSDAISPAVRDAVTWGRGVGDPAG